jgi:hypothetical protein
MASRLGPCSPIVMSRCFLHVFKHSSLPRHINSAFPFKYCYVLLDFRHPCTASRFLFSFESVPHVFHVQCSQHCSCTSNSENVEINSRFSACLAVLQCNRHFTVLVLAFPKAWFYLFPRINKATGPSVASSRLCGSWREESAAPPLGARSSNRR